MSIQRIQPSKRFSEVVIHNNTAYFAGQVPEKTVEAKLADPDWKVEIVIIAAV